VKKYFFSFRVISKWNMLDDTAVTVKSVNSFKTKLETERKMKMGLFTVGLKSAGPRGRHGDLERPSCKYPASISLVHLTFLSLQE